MQDVRRSQIACMELHASNFPDCIALTCDAVGLQSHGIENLSNYMQRVWTTVQSDVQYQLEENRQKKVRCASQA